MTSDSNSKFGSDSKRRALFEKLLQQEKVDSTSPSTIPRRPAAGTVSLSFAQERLWFLDQLEPNSAVYNIPIGLRLKGALNVAVLQRCLDEIIRRHETLRTRFKAIEGRPVQVIEPFASLEMPFIDLSNVPQDQREAEARRLCGEEARRPFDLKHDLMLRARLFRLGEKDHIFFLNMHHIASDGWSVRVLVRELGNLYQAFSEEKASPLPELPVQYADYAVWQREWLQGEVLEKQLSYWRKQLKGVPALLELPTDRPRPATQSYRGALVSYELPKPLSVALGELSRGEGATLFMTLLAGFQTLLHRYTGGDEILVGSAIAGRNRTEIEGLIGFFVNTLVLRGDLSGNPSFRTLLHRTRDMALGAYAHQDLPFERLVEELRPERDLSHSPFFQVMFVLQNAPWAAAELVGLEVTPFPIGSGACKFDLTLSVIEHKESLKVAIEYSTDLFDAETIWRMLTHYQVLLEGIVSNPDQRLSDLPLLTGKERQQLLIEWNRTQRQYPRDKSLTELFEEQVKLSPAAVAVVEGNRSLTYSELNARANQLAHYLLRVGTRRSSCVGIVMERSIEFVVAVMGVLKAGAAYLPLEVGMPPARLRFILRDAAARVVIGRHAELARAAVDDQVSLLELEAVAETLAALSQINPSLASEATDLAYVMYTSGSTGDPKGVAVPHRAVIRLVYANDYLPFDNQQTYLLLAPTAFDASTLEIWGSLLHGSKLVVYPGGPIEPDELRHALEKHHVTCLWLTSALFNTIIDQQPDVLASVSNLLTGGEALSIRHVKRALLRLPATQITNGYGPTEATTFTTTFTIPREFSANALSVPIGRPIANTRVYILDANLQPVPVGVVGELCVGGDGLALGYLDRPDLTAKVFVADPFSSESGARLYRTGDLARYRPDGNIEFLGRNDHQVKVRGFRIELGEIESVLAGHPAVRGAVAVVREDVPGDKRLVAYLTAKEGEPPNVSELRSLLQATLPEYMVPSTFVTLDRFPLTPNGKLDRKALPMPDLARPELEKAFVAPRTPTEEVLAGIWCEVLGLKQVGVHDNFFELGGHSLLAVRLQARVEKQLGKRLPLAAFFQSPTVGELATLLTDGSAPAQGLHVFAPQSPGDKPPLFCLHFLSSTQSLAKHLGPNRPVYGIASPFDEELRLWHERGHAGICVEDLAARCLPILRGVQPRGPYYLAGFCFGGVLAFEIACQLKLQGEEVALLALLDAMYAPGCKPFTIPWIKRWTYHARQVSTRGPAYLLTKLRKKLQLAKRRRSKLVQMRDRSRLPDERRTKEPELPQAEFLSQLLKAYKGKPYAGDTVLFRTVAEPNSFALDLGTTSGWDQVVLGELQVEEIHCNHMDISEEPHVREVARKLENYLCRSDAKATTRVQADQNLR